MFYFDLFKRSIAYLLASGVIVIAIVSSGAAADCRALFKSSGETAISASSNGEPIFYLLPKEGNFSSNLPLTLFVPSKPVKIEIPKRTLPNLWNSLINAYRDVREIGQVLKSERRPIRYKPNVNKFRKMVEAREFSPFGELLWKAIQDSNFIDLGCGDPNYSYMPRLIAQLFGAESYTGVDSGTHAASGRRVNEFGIRAENPFESSFVRQDMLAYLRGLSRRGKHPLTFFIEGIEFNHESKADTEAAHLYLSSVMAEITRVTEPGDHLFVGMTVSFLFPAADLSNVTRNRWSSYEISPADFGFKLIDKYELTEISDGAPASGNHYLWVRE